MKKKLFALFAAVVLVLALSSEVQLQKVQI